MSQSTYVRPRYVTQADAARFVGVHTKTIRRWIERGHITGFKLPGSRAIRVDLNEVERMLQTIPSTVVRVSTAGYGPAARIQTVKAQAVVVERP